MNRKFPLYLLLGMMMSVMAISCNHSSDNDYEPTLISNNTAVTAFNINADENVLANLDSVYFSIDLINRVIYNADSLPKGTKITGLTVTASFATTTSCQIEQTGATVRRDTLMDYTTSDTIDFTGDVKLKLKAADGTEAEYTVKVNVHNVDGDSLYWSEMSRRDLPNVSGTILAQRTAQCGEKIYNLTNSDAGYVLSVTENPGESRWTKVNAQFGMVPDVNSFAASNDALYLLDENGALYTSSDGESWNGCGVVWSHIIGGYTNRVLGVSKQGDAYCYDEYPRQSGFTSSNVAATFPVDGNSQLMLVDNEWSAETQAFMVGGIDANGKYHGDCWGYDGKKWALLRSDVLPALADMTLFEYVTYQKTGVLDNAKQQRAWYVMGGRNLKGDVSNKVYVSHHQGLYWNEADENLQLPDYMGEFCRAQAFVVNTTLTRATTYAWTAMRTKELPVWARSNKTSVSVRVSKPVTEWECPYIYLFGGEDQYGNVGNNIWRGVISRLTFAPIY